MKLTKALVVFILSIVLIQCGEKKETITDEVKKETIESILSAYETCKSEAKNDLSCKNFVAKAICEYNGIDDLKSNEEYIPYHEIYGKVSQGNLWKSIGLAADEQVRIKAQELANAGEAVIAIKTSDKNKFVVLIIKGELSASNKWGGKVPQCATFFPMRSKMKSFINKSLNYAWSRPDGIEFFVKK